MLARKLNYFASRKKRAVLLLALPHFFVKNESNTMWSIYFNEQTLIVFMTFKFIERTWLIYPDIEEGRTGTCN